ncbi:peptide ABC transporter substrate-binding protein [Crocosphaera sp. Alani8]|uniref:peptide ABC transporter substrate-binding protein n=1 Tax=Crocosphaera sp. Alani8 TaxID=3038952 RepID=UPI00406CC5C1
MKKSCDRSFRSWLFSLFLGTCVVLTGCNSQDENLVNSTNNNDTLKLLYWQAPTILNPHLSTGLKDVEASRITLEPLASYDKNGNLIPFLAEVIPSSENGGIAEDGMSVTWTLKQDLKWSDGTPFTAADVVFTYNFLSNPNVGATSAGDYEIIDRVEAIDDYTVKITFSRVNPAWNRFFIGASGMILPRHIYKEYNGENVREAPANLLPIGTGPYKVVEFKPGDVVIYEPNSYFRNAEEIGFQRIELKGGGDATSAARAVLQTGDADYAFNLQIEAPILQQLEAGGNGEVVSLLGTLSERILLNFSDPNKATADGERSNIDNPHPFLTEREVREAFSLAIDRKTISEQLYGITGEPAANILLLPKEYNSANTSYEFNLEKAQQLLDQAGWKDSNNDGTRDKNGVEMKVVFQTSVNPLRQKTQEIVKQGLEAIGVKVELKSIDASIFFSGDPANNDTVEHFYADLQMFTTGNYSPDPSNYMKDYKCDEIPQKANNWVGNNYSRYCNPKYDQLWLAATKELDPKKRQAIFVEMNDILIKDFVVIPLVHRADVTAISNRLQGFDLTPWDRNTWNIKDWK